MLGAGDLLCSASEADTEVHESTADDADTDIDTNAVSVHKTSVPASASDWAADGNAPDDAVEVSIADGRLAAEMEIDGNTAVAVTTAAVSEHNTSDPPVAADNDSVVATISHSAADDGRLPAVMEEDCDAPVAVSTAAVAEHNTSDPPVAADNDS